MSPFALKLSGLLGAALTTSVGSWYIYKSNYPKTLGKYLEWQGEILAKDTDAFKAIFEEKKDSIDKLKESDLTKDTSINDAAQKIKTWCENKFSLELEKSNDEIEKIVSEFCLDSQKTLKGFLVRKGFELISNKDQDYKVTYALYKGINEFTSWLKSGVNDYQGLKTKCDEYFSKDLNQIDAFQISRVSWWCTTPKERTVEELLKKDKEDILSDANDTNLWSNQFDGWKNNDEILSSIKKWNSDSGDLSSNTDSSEGGKKMKKWCEDSKSKNLGDEGVYPDLYSKVKSVCTKKVEKKK